MTSDAPISVPRLARAGAWLLDTLLLLLTPGLSAVLNGSVVVPPGAPVAGASLSVWLLPALWLLFQWLLLARTGATVGGRMAGVGWQRSDGGAPGLMRSLVVRPLPLVSLAVGLLGGLNSSIGVYSRSGVVLLAAAVWLVDAIVLVFRPGRSLRERWAGLALADRRLPETAYAPPRFSAAGLTAALAGLAGAGLLSLLAQLAVQRLQVPSTEVDWALVAAGAALAVGVVLAGALAAWVARRFLVGELALTALLVALLALEAMSARWLPVPSLQRFTTPGLLDFLVYAGGLYFGLLLFLVMGSALGFMVTGDDGLDLSTRFERRVARRHLRLRWVHWLQLAVIATLVPIVVYGVLVWPVRTAIRLVRGKAPAASLPPTVFMGLLTIVGVMFGVMSLTVVLAVMGGFERDLKEKILGTNAHGVLHRYVGEFNEWREVDAKVRATPGVQGVTPFILSEVMITTDDAVAGAVLKGIDVATSAQVTDLARYVGPRDGAIDNLAHPESVPRQHVRPSNEIPTDWERDHPRERSAADDDQPDQLLPAIAIGREMANALHVWIGDRVTVMNPLGELGPTGPIPRSRAYRVGAIFVSGMYEYDSKFAYISLPEAQRFFRMGEAVTGLELRFSHVDEARPLMRQIVQALDGFPYQGKDWGEMNRNLFAALRLERVVMFILLSFQVLIACICVIATLVMLVVEKRKEVATLKAMGARDGSIMKLFVLEGLIIGAIGTFYGCAAGFLFCKLIERFGVGLDPQVYYITRLPVIIEPSAFLSVAVVSLLLVFVATLYPARRGGSIAPVDGFREE